MPVVRLPDGTTVSFPDGTPAQEMQDAIEAHLGKQQAPGIPAAPLPAALQGPSAQLPSMGDKLLGAHPLTDSITSIGSHLKNLVAGPYHAFADAPRNQEEQSIKGTSGKPGEAPDALGQFGLGMSRMFVQPTLDALKKLPQSKNATDVMNNLTDAIPVAGPLSRSIENEAQTKGVVPALLGGAIDIGAPDAVGGVLGKIRGAAPSMAEGAMGIRRGDRGYGKTSGRAILDETTGIRPETVGRQAQSVLDQLNPQIENMAATHQGTIDITPARNTVGDAIDTARSRNNAVGRDALGPVANQLSTNLDNGLPLAANQSATGVLNLKRGLRDAFVKNWSPDAASILTRDTAKNASGVLDSGLDNALGPKFSEVNQRISSLIPVTEAAERLSRADDIPQRFGDKLRAHTGALTAALGGAYEGGRTGGVLGAIAGGTLGFALPELLGGPTARMAIARGMDSRIPQAIAPPLFSGSALNPKEKR